MIGVSTLSHVTQSIVIGLTLSVAMTAQVSDTKVKSWEDVLFANDVDHGEFACDERKRSDVSNYFHRLPLNRLVGVCHNNCAILQRFPAVQWPRLDKRILGQGSIAVPI